MSRTVPVPPKRALLLFTYSPEHEARAKPISGTSFAARVALYRELIVHALHVAGATPYPVLIATDDGAACGSFRNIAHIYSQRGGNFNERLTTALRDAFASGFDEVVVIGNDCASLTARDLRQAFALLRQHEVALGAAADGGVYLIAARRPALESLLSAFARCRWQTAHVQKDMLAHATQCGLTVAVMAQHADIDCAADVLREGMAHRELRVLAFLARRLFLQLLPHFFPPFTSFNIYRRFIRSLYQRPPPPFPRF